MMNPNDKLVMGNSVNWFSKFTAKRQIFDKIRKKCDIDEALREEEEAMELEDSDWQDLKTGNVKETKN